MHTENILQVSESSIKNQSQLVTPIIVHRPLEYNKPVFGLPINNWTILPKDFLQKYLPKSSNDESTCVRYEGKQKQKLGKYSVEWKH